MLPLAIWPPSKISRCSSAIIISCYNRTVFSLQITAFQKKAMAEQPLHVQSIDSGRIKSSEATPLTFKPTSLKRKRAEKARMTALQRKRWHSDTSVPSHLWYLPTSLGNHLRDPSTYLKISMLPPSVPTQPISMHATVFPNEAQSTDTSTSVTASYLGLNYLQLRMSHHAAK